MTVIINGDTGMTTPTGSFTDANGDLEIGVNNLGTTTDTRSLIVASNGYAVVNINGDYSNTAGEPGGSAVTFDVDGAGGTPNAVVSYVNTIGTRGDSSAAYIGTTSNSMLVGTTNATPLYLGTNSIVRATVDSAGVITSPLGGMQLISDTAKTATGTDVDFTDIPSWVKRITVMFAGVSTNGTSQLQVQLGTSSGFVTSGYVGCAGNRSTETAFTTAFLLYGQNIVAANNYNGVMSLNLIGNNIWTEMSILAPQVANQAFGAGSISLGGVLDRIRITTVTGTSTFDAGTINILYE
jgi:hypothetical protein